MPQAVKHDAGELRVLVLPLLELLPNQTGSTARPFGRRRSIPLLRYLPSMSASSISRRRNQCFSSSFRASVMKIVRQEDAVLVFFQNQCGAAALTLVLKLPENAVFSCFKGIISTFNRSDVDGMIRRCFNRFFSGFLITFGQRPFVPLYFFFEMPIRNRLPSSSKDSTFTEGLFVEEASCLSCSLFGLRSSATISDRCSFGALAMAQISRSAALIFPFRISSRAPVLLHRQPPRRSCTFRPAAHNPRWCRSRLRSAAG